MDISTRPSYVEPSTSDAINSARTFIRDCRALVSHLPAHERLVHPVITPRFVPTCTTSLLSQLGDLAKETTTMVQSHMAEAKDQLEFVKRQHGVHDIDIFAQVVLPLFPTIRNILADYSEIRAVCSLHIRSRRTVHFSPFHHSHDSILWVQPLPIVLYPMLTFPRDLFPCVRPWTVA